MYVERVLRTGVAGRAAVIMILKKIIIIYMKKRQFCLRQFKRNLWS